MSGCHPRETYYCGDNRTIYCPKCNVPILHITEESLTEKTITIKQSLWDELVWYRNKVDELEHKFLLLEEMMNHMRMTNY